VGTLDSIRDVQIPQCGGLVDVLAGCPEWKSSHGTAHTHISVHCVTHAVLWYAWPILFFCRSFARIRYTNVSVLVREDSVHFGGGLDRLSDKPLVATHWSAINSRTWNVTNHFNTLIRQILARFMNQSMNL
jgi:hypothetical protein